MKNTRTKQSAKNLFFGVICQLIVTILNFIVRTFFVKYLSTEYLGINGLFLNILSILNMAELGIGTAITYKMYKPVAYNDKEKVKSLLNYYKLVYKIIGLIILVIGLLLIPFLNIIVGNDINIKENIVLIYLIYLIEAVCSYFYSHKRAMATVTQNEYIASISRLVVYTFKCILQIIILKYDSNFLLYLVIYVLAMIGENLVVCKIMDKKYPYIKDKEYKVISKDEKIEMFKNVKALLLYKIGSAIYRGVDNIIISMFVNISMVGICSNYTLIINAIDTTLKMGFNGVVASIGNLNVTTDIVHREKIYHQLLLVTIWIYGFCSICLLLLIDPFIKLWLGDEYLLDFISSIFLVLSIYLYGVERPSVAFRNTLGLHEKGKYAPLIAGILNIILSIFFVKKIGLSGVFIATAVARVLTTVWTEPYIIYKYIFKKSPNYYYLKMLIYSLVVVLNFIICNFVISFINKSSIYSFLIKAVISVILSNAIFLLCFFKLKDFKEVYKKIKKIFN